VWQGLLCNSLTSTASSARHLWDVYQSGTTKANLETEMLVQTFIDSIDTVSTNLVEYRNALSKKSGDGLEQDSVQKIVAECRC
jgi:hypothetical protein